MSFIETGLPCVKCDSSDAMAIDENGWGKCFSCDANIPPSQLDTEVLPVEHTNKGTRPVTAQIRIDCRGFPDRKITRETAKKYGAGFDGMDIVFPFKNGTAYKIRLNGEKDRQTIKGDFKEATTLYGQELSPENGKRIVITEGEFDAMALSQMLGKWNVPVVSVRNGASGAVKDIKANYHYLDTFDEVIFFFDNDTAGKEAAEKCAEVFSHKAKIVKGFEGFKDACDYLVANKSADAVKIFWNASKWTPAGIINGNDLYDELMKPLAKADADYPWEGLNKITYGIRKGELIVVTAGSGLGKSQFIKEIVFHLLNTTQDNIGTIFLEESVRKTGLSLMSLAANKPLHLPTTEATQEEKDSAFKATMGKQRIYMLSQFGSEDVDTVVDRIRYLAKGADCKYIILDHVSIVISAQSNGDERKALDELMTKLRMLVEETGISLIAISHLKRPDKKGHEEGASTSLAQLRGSGSIAQLSDMVIGLERNGQADCDIERNTTHVRVLKNRFAGVTGKATQLLYNLQTNRMTELEEEVL